MRRKLSPLYLVFGLSFVLPVAAQAAGSADALAKFLAETAGTPGGLCALPRCADPDLPVALARAGQYLVHVTHPDAQVVQRLNDAAGAQKIIGREMVAEIGTMRRLVFADQCVNAVILADLSAADLQEITLAEILRVLVPHGKAVIGRAKSAGPGVTSQQLLTWAKQASGEAVALDNELGTWVVLTKPALPGSDNWSHWNHGPDNNPLSVDTARTWPSMVQWFGRPYNRERNGFLLVAGGRVFTAAKALPSYAHPESPSGVVFAGDTLVGRDAYNGRVLWSRKLTSPPSYLLPVWIAQDDRFYLVEGPTVVALDAATGKDAERYTLGTDQQEIRWMVLLDRSLYALLREKPAAAKPNRGTAAEQEDNARGTILVAWDMAKDKEQWRYVQDAPIDARAVALSTGRLFAYAPGAQVFSLDAATGSLRWSFADDKVLESMTKLLLDGNKSIDGITLYRAGLVASPKALVVNLNSRESRLVFDAETGKVLWDSKLIGGNGGRGGHMLIYGERLLAKGMPGKDRELLTGKEFKDSLGLGGGCGRFVGTPGGILGMLNEFFDQAKHTALEHALAKPDCHTGTILANGLTFDAPGGCRCALPLRGFLVEAARPADLAPISDEVRLETFAPPAGSATPATAQDWPVYRGSNQHSGSTSVSIGTGALSSKWVSAAGGSELTPPVAVGDRVFVAGADGVIRALDSTNGRQVWQYATAGRIRVAPTYWNGRIYAGSADGYVYCLSAETGRLFWRFCAAPAQRRIMVLDGLSSTWPVNSGVLVHDGVAYAMAGFSDREDVHVWGLDAVSGRIRWHNDQLAALGIMPMGGMTIAGEHLWLRTNAGMPALALKTGVLAEQPNLRGGRKSELAPSVRGDAIGVLGDRFIIQGGFRQYADQWERTLGRGHNFGLIELEGRSLGQYPMIRPLEDCVLLPVWDTQLILIPREQFRKAKKLEAWDPAKLIVWAAEQRAQAAPGLAKMFSAEIQAAPGKLPAPVWEPIDHDINAAALASDAIALAEGTHTAKSPWVPDGWQVATIDRAGKPLWQAKLPAEPMYDGLCIDRHGKIIMSLVDGSVICFGK